MIPSVVARQIRETVLDYLQTTFSLADPEFESALLGFLDERLFKGPYIDLRLPFRKAALEERVPLDIQPAFTPYKHQLKSFQRLYSRDGHQPQHTLVTTGTGSGKTECFLYPILDHCWRHRDEPGIKAIILYPMNALASDQAGRIAELLWHDERLRGQVSAGLFVGGKGRHGTPDEKHLIDDRSVLRDSPPDILLTNYKMLDFLLLRPEDRGLWRNNAPETLRYLVLDELHTYDGAQGSDVACLIRRLRDRVDSSRGSICCVGTSATIGDSSSETAAALTAFASKVFDTNFFDDSLITEDRLTARETFGSEIEHFEIPFDAPEPSLAASEFDNPQDWIAEQARLWFGIEAADPPTLCAELERSDFLRELLKALGGSPKTLHEVDQAFAERNDTWMAVDQARRHLLLESFLGLVASARRESGGRQEPFLTLQAQLWIRELRHLVRRVQTPAEGFEFAWASDMPDGAGKWLPIAYCRECGSSGLATYQRIGEAKLQDELSEIGRAWLNRTDQARYLQLGSEDTGLLRTVLHPDSLAVGSDAPNADTGVAIPIRLAGDTSQQTPPRFLARCPDCQADGALSMLGSRAPSLLSVAVSDVFTSEFNLDKKLLAFTDSVQDASHRAGFFGARTYRFNLRTAIQGVLERSSHGVPLPRFSDALFERWETEVGRTRLLATLLPSDLRELPSYLRFLETRGEGPHRRLEADLRDRLSWEVTMEYGHRSTVGRTLEATRCSTVEIDEMALREATKRLSLELRETTVLESQGADVSEAAVRHFLDGLLYRARRRGAIWHPFLRSYAQQRGKKFLLSRRRQRLISPFGRSSVYPRFLTDFSGTRAGREEIFDSVLSPARSQTWFRDWAARSLQVAAEDSGTNDLYRQALKTLTLCGVLKAEAAAGKCTAWALDPEKLNVTRCGTRLECDDCGSNYLVPVSQSHLWLGRSCLEYKCSGSLQVPETEADSYYGRIYRSGRLHRVFPAEHTGLLTREEREALEEHFREQDMPDGPNLLVATPTLEMGIDIGDLSAAVLCAVPPTPANFLQRVGRSGRKTGNALCVTLANARPHDLYFYSEPLEMLAGQVLPPGCFLDAPEMLKRQLVAHGMDAWAREDTEAAAIPHKVAFILSDQNTTGFPSRFLDFYDGRKDKLTAQFLERFSDYLSPANREELDAFGQGNGVRQSIEEALDRVRRERDDLRLTRDRVRKRLQKLQELEEPDEETKIEIEDVKAAVLVIGRLIEDQGKKYPLNVFTDEGVLPNYAFPEAGVVLDSVLRQDGDDGQRSYETREYIRPASSAIRELAPFNTFYAEGKRVRVDEIDVGSPARPLTTEWRLCAECAYMARETTLTEVSPGCPRCGDSAWADSGQVRALVNFRRSRSLTGRLEASTVDDSDDREEEYYRTGDLIDVGPQHWNGARLIPDLPFGYELLRSLILRELNYGREGGHDDHGLRIAGSAIGDRAFEVCMGCGRVKERDGQIRHAPYCRWYRDESNAKIQAIHLYREISSEALRILLPFSEVNLENRRASFKAALELGLRRHFQGDPGHLQIKIMREPVPGGGYRQFLVLFDAVPGGTGYLADLWREGQFLEVLNKALVAMQQCACQRRDPPADGCYRCIYAYQRQKELEVISSREAQAMLGEVLSRRNEFQDIHTLSHASVDYRLESELEDKFVAALRARIESESESSWREVVKGGEVRWNLKSGAQAWEIRAQVDLGPTKGVSQPSRPDFLISPADGDPSIRPVAVFCDGFAYHVQPDKPESRIYDDVDKRLAIIESGKFQCWSVTWKDVADFEAKRRQPSHPLLFRVDDQAFGQVHHKLAGQLDRGTAQAGSMEMLLAYLRHPATYDWEKLADAYVLGWLRKGPWLDGSSAATVPGALLDDDDPSLAVGLSPQPTSNRIATWASAFSTAATAHCSPADLQGSASAPSVVIRLFDDRVARGSDQFEDSWRACLNAWNLLQFRQNITVQTTERIRRYGGQAQTYAHVSEPTPPTAISHDAIEQLFELATEDTRPLILALNAEGLPQPVLDFELSEGDTQRCGPQAELAWPSFMIAALGPSQEQDRKAFEERNWIVFDVSRETDSILQEVRQRALNKLDSEV